MAHGLHHQTPLRKPRETIKALQIARVLDSSAQACLSGRRRPPDPTRGDRNRRMCRNAGECKCALRAPRKQACEVLSEPLREPVRRVMGAEKDFEISRAAG